MWIVVCPRHRSLTELNVLGDKILGFFYLSKKEFLDWKSIVG